MDTHVLLHADGFGLMVSSVGLSWQSGRKATEMAPDWLDAKVSTK